MPAKLPVTRGIGRRRKSGGNGAVVVEELATRHARELARVVDEQARINERHAKEVRRLEDELDRCRREAEAEEANAVASREAPPSEATRAIVELLLAARAREATTTKEPRRAPTVAAREPVPSEEPSDLDLLEGMRGDLLRANGEGGRGREEAGAATKPTSPAVRSDDDDDDAWSLISDQSEASFVYAARYVRGWFDGCCAC